MKWFSKTGTFLANDATGTVIRKGIYKLKLSLSRSPSSIANLKGEQNGEYEMDIKTGMVVNSKINSELDGTVAMMGREISITMEMPSKVNGKKVN